MLRIFAFVSLLGLASCGGMIAEMSGIPVVDPNNVAAVAEHTADDYDTYKGTRTVEGPLIFHDKNLFGKRYAIRYVETSGGQSFYQIYTITPATEWMFLDQAYAGGKELETVVIKRSVDSCSGGLGCDLSETVGVTLTEDQMRQAAANGFSFKLAGRSGSAVYTIPAPYFSAVYKAVNGSLREVPAS